MAAASVKTDVSVKAKLKVNLLWRDDDPKCLAGYDIWAEGDAEITVTAEGGRRITLSVPAKLLAGYYASVPDAQRPAHIYRQRTIREYMAGNNIDRSMWEINLSPVDDYGWDGREAIVSEVFQRLSDEDLFGLYAVPEAERDPGKAALLREELRASIVKALHDAYVEGADHEDYHERLKEWLGQKSPALAWMFSMIDPKGLLMRSILSGASWAAQDLLALEDFGRLTQLVLKKAASIALSPFKMMDFSEKRLFAHYERLVEVKTLKGNTALLPVHAVSKEPVQLDEDALEEKAVKVASIYLITLDSARDLVQAYQEAVEHCFRISEEMRDFEKDSEESDPTLLLLRLAGLLETLTACCPGFAKTIKDALRRS